VDEDRDIPTELCPRAKPGLGEREGVTVEVEDTLRDRDATGPIDEGWGLL
jgi:hypothetical protein